MRHQDGYKRLLMKKPLFILLCLVSLSCSSQVRWGVQLGYDNADFRQRGDIPMSGSNSHFSSINTFQAGLLAEIRLGKHWFLDPSLLYHGNGAELSDEGLLVSNRGKNQIDHLTLKVFYLKLPVNLLYKIRLGKKLDAFAGAGLYIARGIYGREKGNAWSYNPTILPIPYETPSQTSVSVDQKVHFSNGTNTTTGPLPPVRPFDFGYDLVAGIEWGHFRLTPGLSEGLGYALKGGGYQQQNSVFSVTLAYMVKL
jgi:hypothetical protein